METKKSAVFDPDKVSQNSEQLETVSASSNDRLYSIAGVVGTGGVGYVPHVPYVALAEIQQHQKSTGGYFQGPNLAECRQLC